MRILSYAALAAATLATACVAYGPPAPGAPVGYAAVEPGYYDAWYDGYYGPFVDGYWGVDGGFWYVDRDRGWHRDAGGHFRRETYHGYAHVRGTGAHREH